MVYLDLHSILQLHCTSYQDSLNTAMTVHGGAELLLQISWQALHPSSIVTVDFSLQHFVTECSVVIALLCSCKGGIQSAFGSVFCSHTINQER